MNTGTRIIAHEDGKTWMTTRQMAAYLRLNPKTLLRVAQHGVVPCIPDFESKTHFWAHTCVARVRGFAGLRVL